MDRFLALTDRIAEHLVSAGIRRDRVTVRPNTVPDPGAHSTDRRGVLFAGRLTEDKGIRVLLDAWTRVAPGSLGTLTIAGAGPERGTVEAMATSREDVVYLGALPPARVIELMLRAAAVVVPSVWADVFPRVVVESLACGTAVVASDIGGFPSIVTPDVGSLAGPGDAQALAHALRHVTGDATSLGAAARRRYLQHYSPDVVMRQLIAVYGQLAGRGRGA